MNSQHNVPHITPDGNGAKVKKEKKQYPNRMWSQFSTGKTKFRRRQDLLTLCSPKSATIPLRLWANQKPQRPTEETGIQAFRQGTTV